MKNKNRVIAIYIRLSDEDEDVDNKEKIESNSITNQRAMLQQYIKEHEEFVGKNVIEFTDDGYSGTNFNRPRFGEMLKEVCYGNVECVIVKDFSRFGRNYLESGNYLERIFPMCETRFISINDDFDSNDFIGVTGGISMALKNFLYNMYSKDISQKVTTAMQTRIKMGQHMSAFAAYGYRKNPEDIHQLIVDETSAAIVRRIYQMAADGIGKSMIARTLNEEGVKTPIEYMNSIGTNKRSLREMEKKLWATNSVGDMIRNEVYLGKLVWNKSSIAVMGSHKQKKNPRSKWLIVEGSHEPLVSQELFDLANEKAFPGKKRTNTKAKGGTLLHCGSCGRIMNLNGSNKGYRCAQACSTGLPECRIIKAPRFEIEDEILQKTKEKAAEYLTELKKNKAKWHHDVREWKGTDALKEKESKLSMKKMRIYDQFKSGKISQDTYSEKMAVTNVKLEEIRQELADIKKRASEAEYNLTASVELEEKFKAIMKLEEYSVVEIKKLLDYVTLLVDGTRAYVWKKKV